jgi:4'-phosphopantetheinyl transferase
MIDIYFEEVFNPGIYSNAFLRKILSKYLHVNNNELNIVKTKYGKPYLKSYRHMHFNISHTREAIACAISDKQIGIDIERIKPFNKRIAEKFFTKNEQEYIFNKREDENVRFFEVWTRKEAYVKWLGKGMVIPFNSFDVLKDSKILTNYIGDYVLSVCSTNKTELNEIDNFSYYNCKII